MALNIEQIIADLKESSILELSELVSTIEEEFGVSAAALCSSRAGGAKKRRWRRRTNRIHC